MSNLVESKLKKYPLLTRYAQSGLVNFNALARLFGNDKGRAAVGMKLRRYISGLPKTSLVPFDFTKYHLQLVTRTNIQEMILDKSLNNRKICLDVINTISRTKYFVSVVEGEREIVLMTDYPLKKLFNKGRFKSVISYLTNDLSFISVNFPVEMRQVPGIYSLVTSSLADANISIHSFHTIGGEILILVKNKDLLKSHEVLKSLLFD